MLNILADLANELDSNQAHRLADKITSMMKTASDDYDQEPSRSSQQKISRPSQNFFKR